jgi:glucokinase
MTAAAEAVVAIDVGGTALKGALIDGVGRELTLERRTTPVDDGPDAVIEAVLGLASELAESCGGRPGAVGLAVPGVVDTEAGVVHEAANLGWRAVAIGELARSRLDVAVCVLHDARAAALAEGLVGAARGVRDWLLLTLGTGVGAAVMLGGEAYVGPGGSGGELGHATIDPRGPVCACGRRGCLEAYASAGHIARHYTARSGRAAGAAEVVQRAAAGDPVAQAVWSDALDALAIAIANYDALLDPDLVVIGGGMAAAGEELFAPLARLVRSRALFGDPPPVVPAALGERAGRLGAAIAAWRAAGVPDTVFHGWAASQS